MIQAAHVRRPRFTRAMAGMAWMPCTRNAPSDRRMCRSEVTRISCLMPNLSRIGTAATASSCVLAELVSTMMRDSGMPFAIKAARIDSPLGVRPSLGSASPPELITSSGSTRRKTRAASSTRDAA